MSFQRSTSLVFPTGRSSDAPGALGGLGRIAVYLILGALTLSPLLATAVPPLVDYPDHLARMWILLHAKDIPALASNYIVDWRLSPNLAMDLVVPSLARLMPLEDAGRLFVALTMASLVLGTMTLHRALYGRIGLWPLASLLFVYNSVLYWGFVNFLFTLGLALVTFSAWVASERWPAHWRALVFALPASLLLVFHLFGFGIYGLLVASYAFGKLRQERRWTGANLRTTAIVMAQFIPAVLLWAAALGNGGASYTRYHLEYKLMDLVAPATFGWMPRPLDWAVLVLTIFFLCYAKGSGAVRLAPSMRWPIMAMIVAAVVMPNWLAGGWAADLRLPIALPFVVLASMRFAGTRRALGCFAVVALALLGIRVWTVTESWRDADRRFAEFRAASRSIPEGARLLVVETPMTPDECRIDGVPFALAQREPLALWHMPALAAIDRSAFLPYLFFNGWNPLRPHPRNAGLYQAHGTLLLPSQLVASASPDWRPSAPDWPDELGEMPYWVNWPDKFDFVLWIDFSRMPGPLPEQLQPWAGGSFFKIYRVVR